MGAMTSLNLASNNICPYGDMDGIKAIYLQCYKGACDHFGTIFISI
jgi:hypothetical protein